MTATAYGAVMSNMVRPTLVCLVAGALLGGCGAPLPRERPRSGGRPSADVVEGKRLLDELRYSDAEACFQRALVLEPGDAEIVEYLEKVRRLRSRERVDGEWESVRQRHVSLSGILDCRQVLKSRKVTLNFPDTPFAEVISFLQDISGLNITVSPTVDQAEITVSLRLREIPLEDALRIILEQTQLAMTVTTDALLISRPEEARGPFDLELYDVQDLLSRIPDFVGERIRIGDEGGGGGAGSFSFDTEQESDGSVLDPDRLETIVTNSLDEDDWDEPASIEIHRGQIIVNQTREMHWKIRDVLQQLRLAKGLETRPFGPVAAVRRHD